MIRHPILKSLVVGLAVLTGCGTNGEPQATTAPNSAEDISIETVPTRSEESLRIQTPPELDASAPPTLRLKLSVTGLDSNQGECKIAIYSGKPGFNQIKQAAILASVPVMDEQILWEKDIDIALWPERWFAIAVYQDENQNGKFDKGAFGIPTEKYGFSRSPKRGYGPPSYDETKLEIEGEQQFVEIAIQ